MSKVSFIIPSYNSYKTIERTLSSIFQQKAIDLIKEIIVVDSSEDEKTKDLIAALSHHKLKFIFLDTKTSPALGRNIGAQNATGDILCFIDSDVYLDESWLGNIIKAYGEGCKIGGGSISIPDFQIKNKVVLAQFYLQLNEFLETGITRSVIMVPACNMFVDRMLFEQIEGFPNLRAAEEVVLCLKLSKYAKIWFMPQAKCFHIFREDIGSFFINQKLLGKYIIIYRRMTFNKWYYKSIWPLILLPVFLIIKITRIKLRIYKAGWQHYKKFFISSPLFLAGLYYWSIGFISGCIEKNTNSPSHKKEGE